VQRIPLCGSLFLHVIEAADELLVRTLQRRFGIDAVEPRSVDQRKEQVAELGFEVRLVARAHLGLDFGGLLLHLVPHILALLPVEARRRGLLAYAECLDQRRQRAGNAAQRTALAVLFAELECLPILLHLVGRIGMNVAVNVRMAVYQFVAQGVSHIRIVERPGFLTQLGVEHHMQQQVAQLLLDPLHIVVGDGIGQFIRLLDRIAPQRVERLLAIPRALAAQRGHHVEQAGRSLQSFIFHYPVCFFRRHAGRKLPEAPGRPAAAACSLPGRNLSPAKLAHSAENSNFASNKIPQPHETTLPRVHPGRPL